MLPSYVYLLTIFVSFCLSLDIQIGGIFKIDSISEKAFALANLIHNASPNRGKFRLKGNYAMLPKFDSNTVMDKICNQTSKTRVLAIFGGNFTYVLQEVSDISQILQIPIFTTDLDTRDVSSLNQVKKDDPSKSGVVNSNNTNFLIYMQPGIIDTLIDYLIEFKWFSFSYICNTGEGLYHMQRIIQKIHSTKDYVELNIDVRFISDPRLATKDLRNLDAYLKSMKIKRILLNIDTKENLEEILHQIVLMGMNRPEYNYIILNGNIGELNLHEFHYSGVEIIGFSVLNNINNKKFDKFKVKWKDWLKKSNIYDSNRFLLEASLMLDAFTTFTKALETLIKRDRNYIEKLLSDKSNHPNCYLKSKNNRKLIGYHNRQYKVSSSKIGKLIMQQIVKNKIPDQNSGDLNYQTNGLRTNYSVQVLQMKLNHGLKRIGRWDQKQGLFIEEEAKKLLFKQIARNQTVRVVTIEAKPFLQLKKAKNNEKFEGNDRFEGFCVDLLHKISKRLNFKYEIHLVHDNNYGAKIGEYPNKTEIWNGMIGELMNGTADIAVAPLTISLARAKVVHFSEPFLMFGLSVMIKRPGPKKAGIFNFLRPLSYPVWSCYIAACLVVSCGLYVIARLSPYEWNSSNIDGFNGDNGQSVMRDFTFFNCLWFSIAASVQQGVDVAPKSPGARILSAVWWFFTLIMIAYYTANLAAFLTISLIIAPINDWHDLIKPNVGIEYGSLNSGSTKNFFLSTSLEPFRTIGQHMKANPRLFANTVTEGVEKVRKSKGNYAFLLESRMNEYFNQREPCDTMMVATPFGDKGYGIATPLNFTLKEEVTDAILKLRETQELTKLYEDWWIKRGQCNTDKSNSKSDALLLINVAGVFYILAGGLTFAMLISMIEFYYESRKKSNKIVMGRLYNDQWRPQLYSQPLNQSSMITES